MIMKQVDIYKIYKNKLVLGGRREGIEEKEVS